MLRLVNKEKKRFTRPNDFWNEIEKFFKRVEWQALLGIHFDWKIFIKSLTDPKIRKEINSVVFLSITKFGIDNQMHSNQNKKLPISREVLNTCIEDTLSILLFIHLGKKLFQIALAYSF
jgi:hypothetical protein